MKIILTSFAMILLLAGCDANPGTANTSSQPPAQTAGAGTNNTLSGGGLGGPGNIDSSSAGSAGGLGGGAGSAGGMSGHGGR